MIPTSTCGCTDTTLAILSINGIAMLQVSWNTLTWMLYPATTPILVLSHVCCSLDPLFYFLVLLHRHRLGS